MATPPRKLRNIMPIRVVEDKPPEYKFDKCIRVKNTNKWHHIITPEPEAIITSELPVEEYHSIEEIIDRPGIYTWVLFADRYNIRNDVFVARRAITPGEVLSKHKNIVRNSDTPLLLMAGEVKIMPDRVIEYNLASGTYMPSVLKPSRGELRVSTHTLHSYMYNKWVAAGAEEVIFNENIDESLISRNVNNSNLEPYRRAGFRLSEPFETREKCYTDYYIGQGPPAPSPLVFDPVPPVSAPTGPQAPKGGAKQTKKRRRPRRSRRSRSTRS